MTSTSPVKREPTRAHLDSASGTPPLGGSIVRERKPCHLKAAFPPTLAASQVAAKGCVQPGRRAADKRAPLRGAAKASRIDLGLELLRARTVPGERWNATEIAAWCDCDDALIHTLELRALRKLREALAQSLTKKEMKRCRDFFRSPLPTREPAQPASFADPDPYLKLRPLDS